MARIIFIREVSYFISFTFLLLINYVNYIYSIDINNKYEDYFILFKGFGTYLLLKNNNLKINC